MALSGGGRDMAFTQVTHGISKQGIEGYLEYLKLSIITQIEQKLDDTSGFETAINKGWQGASRDVFFEKVGKAIKSTKDEINAEFNNLRLKLSQLTNDYYGQDKAMINLLDK